MLGRLTRDPELRDADKTSYVKTAIAVDRRYNRDETDFFNMTAFGKTAEFMNKYFARGSKVLIEGRLQSSTYEKNGEKRTSIEVIVEQVEFAESKKKVADKGDRDFGNRDFGGSPVDDEDTPF